MERIIRQQSMDKEREDDMPFSLCETMCDRRINAELLIEEKELPGRVIVSK